MWKHTVELRMSNPLLCCKPDLGASTLLITLFLKMVSTSIALGSGFVGGQLFPVLFMGSCVGNLTYQWVPAVPPYVAIPCCIAAVPAALFPAFFRCVRWPVPRRSSSVCSHPCVCLRGHAYVHTRATALQYVQALWLPLTRVIKNCW